MTLILYDLLRPVNASVALLAAFFSLLPAAASTISPYALGLDGIGEIVLTVWLLAFGLDAAKWQATAHRER